MVMWMLDQLVALFDARLPLVLACASLASVAIAVAATEKPSSGRAKEFKLAAERFATRSNCPDVVTKRLTNILVAFVLLAGFAFGAYTVGRLVTDESNELARNAGLTPTDSPTAASNKASSNSNDTRERLKWIAGLTAVGVALWIVLAFVVDRTFGFFRYRRRQRLRRQW